MKKYFSKNLCEFREEKGLTQVQIARRLGISVSTYANWEQGRREPSIENIMYLCALFDCEPNDLFEWNEELKFSLQADYQGYINGGKAALKYYDNKNNRS